MMIVFAVLAKSSSTATVNYNIYTFSLYHMMNWLIMASSTIFKKYLQILPVVLFICTKPIWAQPVDLITNTGNISISGVLVEFDEELIIVETSNGRLTFRRSDVSCAGPGCPVVNDRTQQITFLENEIMPKSEFISWLKRYANQSDKTLSYERSRQISAVNIWSTYKQPDTKVSFKKGPNPLSINVSTHGIPIGLGTVNLVSRNKVIPRVSIALLNDIWTGRIANWSQLGGENEPIKLMLPIFSYPITSSLESLDNTFTLQTLHPGAQFYLDSTSIMSEVNNNPNALGFVFGSHQKSDKLRVKIKCTAETDKFHELFFPISSNSTSTSAFTSSFMEFLAEEYLSKENTQLFVTLTHKENILSDISDFKLVRMVNKLKNQFTVNQNTILINPNEFTSEQQIELTKATLEKTFENISFIVSGKPVQIHNECKSPNSFSIGLSLQ